MLIRTELLSLMSFNNVIEFKRKLHGNENFYVLDKSIIPVNLTVNPSLTITAQAEYLMDKIPSNHDN